MLFKRFSLIVVISLSIVFEVQSAVISNAVRPVPYFSGRTDEINKINRLFSFGEAAISIVGISGIGKTETIRKYVFENIEKYEIVWFFDIKTDLRMQFQLLAREINQAYGQRKTLVSEELDSCIESVTLYIRGKNGWLFVFDNLSIGENNKITKFIDQHHNGHIIVTSQDRSNLKNIIHINFLNYEMSKKIIRKILRTATKSQVQKMYDDFHGYPLLLVQYSYFIRDNLDTSLVLSKSEPGDHLTALIKKLVEVLNQRELKLLIKISNLNNSLLERDFLLMIAEDSRDIFTLNRLNLVTISQRTNNKKSVVFTMHNLIKDKLLNIANTKLVKESILELIEQTTNISPKSKHLYGNILKEYPGLLSNLEYLLENSEKNEIDISKILELRKALLISYLYLLDYEKIEQTLLWFKKNKETLVKDQDYDKQKAEDMVIFLVTNASYKKFIDKDLSESESIKDFEEAIKIVNNKGAEHLKCYAYEEYAQTLVYSGDVDKAFEKIEIAKNEGINKTDLEVDKGTLYFTVAKIYLEKGEYELALKYIRQSQELEVHLGESQFSEPSYELEAAILSRKGDYKQAYEIAKAVYKRSDSYFDNDHELKTRALIILSWSQAGLGMIAEAEKNIKRVQDFFKSHQDVGSAEHSAHISIVESEIALGKKEYEKALDLYIEAANNLKQIYCNNLKNDFYGYILEKIVMTAKITGREVHMRHYMLEHQEIFGKFSDRSKRIDALF